MSQLPKNINRRNPLYLSIAAGLAATGLALAGCDSSIKPVEAAKEIAAACNPCNPCAAKICNPCNPCNPCAAKACNPCNPCAAKACNPCNPCAAKACNPCTHVLPKLVTHATLVIHALQKKPVTRVILATHARQKIPATLALQMPATRVIPATLVLPSQSELLTLFVLPAQFSTSPLLLQWQEKANNFGMTLP